MGAAMWDSGGRHEINQCLWDAVASVDPPLKVPADVESYGSAEELLALWEGAALKKITIKEISFPCEFSSFEELWVRHFIEGQGVTAAYVKSLSEDRRIAVREQLEKNYFGDRSDGPLVLTAKAWAVRGFV
jgi:hypothetical protein